MRRQASATGREVAENGPATQEGYSLTAAAALDAAKRVAAGEVEPGFQTPSRAFGPDYILTFDGVMREDLNR